MRWYEDDSFLYVWKPAGLPSTPGGQFSCLDQIEKEAERPFQRLQEVRTKDQERGLLNRLDNDTAGLLYFAKTPVIADAYRAQQESALTTKRYICDMQGDMRRFANTNSYVQRTQHPLMPADSALCVTYPIMHHMYDDQKMIVVRQGSDVAKGRGKEHHVKTFFIPLYYDEATDTTTAYALITQ